MPGIQRTWLMAWLVIGQVYGLPVHSIRLRTNMSEELQLLACLPVAGFSTIGGFVVVGLMMVQDEVCISI